jgi:ATPase subunit of ABC transporter with duplicated ATPase domains
MEKFPKPILEKRSISLSDSMSDRSGNDVLIVEGLKKQFGEKLLFDDVNLTIQYKERIGIIGKNGCGKTTLIKTILGQEPVDAGVIKLGTKLSIGYLEQNCNFENGTQTILDYYTEQFGISSTEARNRLAKILFTGNDVFKKIGTLSGGEKKRLQLSILLDKNPNFLILDEPTNHLDLNSREILEENLENFQGNLIIVSHDRYFVNKLTDKLWVYNKKTFTQVNGNYEYFRQNKELLLDMPKGKDKQRGLSEQEKTKR